MPQKISFDDLGAKPVQAAGSINFDDLGGKAVQTAPQQSNSAPEEEPGILDKTIPLTSYGNANLYALQNIGRGVRQAYQSVKGLVSAPQSTGENAAGFLGPAAVPLSRLLQGTGQAAGQVSQLPGAIHDINQSPDPAGTYADVAARTSGEGAGQALTALATEGLTRIPGVARAAKSVATGANLKAAGGALFNAVDKAATAANLTVDASRAFDAAGELLDNVDVGGRNTQIIRKFMNRVTDPTQGPLTYDEARGFYSNAGNLGFSDTNSMTGTTKYLFDKFTRALDADIRDATATIGQDENYGQAMAKYRQAKVRGERYDTYAPIVTKAAVKGAAGALGFGAVGVPLYQLFKSH